MTELIVFWSFVLVIAWLLATLREIYDDGRGRRPPPPSHYDPFDPHLRAR